MRTKHILTALALPALFAACTADDFVNEGINAGLQERAKLSKDFKLVTSEASTRYTVNDNGGSLSFVYNEGDKIGAAIVDEYVPNKQPKEWKIIPSLAGNTPFENKGNDVWQASSELGIGHYIYVYPYNAKDNNRAALSYELPAVQKLYTDENGEVDLQAAIKSSNKAVYAALLTEGETELAASFKNLYAYPKFVINFDNGEPITEVTQVVLQNKSVNKWEVKGGLSHAKVSKLFADAAEAVDLTAYWNSKQTADFLLAGGTNTEFTPSVTGADYADIVKSDYIIAKLPKNAKLGENNVSRNKYIEVRFMIPGALGTSGVPAYAGDLDMYVYTNNGIYEVTDVARKIEFKSTTAPEVRVKALARSTSYSLQVKAAKSNANLNIVTNVADWNELVGKYGASAAFTNATPFEVAIVGGEFAMDATAKMPSKAIFQIKTDFSVKGDVKLVGVKATGTVTVEKGATLTTTPTATIANVVNKGKLTFTAKTDNNDNVVEYNGVTSVINEGTVTVPAGVEVAFALYNKANGVVAVEKGAATRSAVEGGILTVKDLAAAVDGKNGNYGIINNQGTMNVARLTNNVDDRDATTGEYKVIGTIMNEGEIMSVATNGLVNSQFAKITNAGEMTCSNTKGGTIVNNGTLDAAGTVTYITTNSNTGVIISPTAVPTNIIVTNQSGTVQYTTSKASETFKNSIVTKVIANGTLAIADMGKLATIEVGATATLTLPAAKLKIDNLTVAGGTTTLGSDIEVKNLNVEAGAKVIVPAGKTLEIKTALKNKGSILVGGTFKSVTKSTDAGAGTVKESGQNATIKWDTNAVDPEASQKAAYETALKEGVAEYITKKYNTLYSGDSYDVTAATFNTVLGAVNSSNSGTYPKLWSLRAAMAAYSVTDGLNYVVPATDLAAAVTAVKEDNKAALVSVLDAATYTPSAAYLADDAATATDPKTGEQKAIEAFKQDVKSITESVVATSLVNTNGADFVKASAVTLLTDAEVKAYIEKGCAYVYTGCEVEGLVKIWKENVGIADLTIAGYKYVYNSTAGTVLVNWLKAVLNSTVDSPAVKTAQKAIESYTLSSVEKFKDYSAAQIKAIDDANAW